MRKIIKEHNLSSDDEYEVYFEYIVIAEPMTKAMDLLERWSGISTEELALLIDQSHDENILKFWFPRAYILRKTLKDKSGSIIYYCDSSISVETGEYTKPYVTSEENSQVLFNFENVIFKKSELLKYEKDNPSVLYEAIDRIDPLSDAGVSARQEPANEKDLLKILCRILAEGINTGLFSEDSIFSEIDSNKIKVLKVESLLDIEQYRKSIETSDASDEWLEKSKTLLRSCDKSLEEHLKYITTNNLSVSEETMILVLEGKNAYKVHAYIKALLLLALRFVIAAYIASTVSIHFILRCKEAEDELTDLKGKINNPAHGGNDEKADEWEDSVTAACKAVAHVVQEDRRDWVSGQEKGTGDTDSVGKETFRALLKRMHPQGIRCRVKAETAAWRVISNNGYTHTGGRKPNP